VIIAKAQRSSGSYHQDNSEGPNMVEAIHTKGEVWDLAKAYLLAQSTFNRAFCRFWHAEVQPCSDESGRKILGVFRNAVETFRLKSGRDELGMNHAARELFRLTLVGEADYSFDEAAEFVKWYERLKNAIGVAIAHLFEFHGDSFGDLIDAYPLAGPELVKRALASHPKSDRPRREGFLDEQELHDAVREKLGPGWYKVICRSENYVVHSLEVACYKCYVHRILTGEDERVSWTEAERSAADFAGQYCD
jgi:hypothetical protein